MPRATPTPEQAARLRRIRQDTARNMTDSQRRGMVNLSESQRVIVIDFVTPNDAARWDRLTDEQAFYELWVRASEAGA